MSNNCPDSLAILEQAKSERSDIQVSADSTGVELRLRQPPLEFRHSFIDGPLARRARQREQAILRACNNKQRSILSVLDLTAGWGIDALGLACHGQRVHLLEHNPLIYAVIAHALACAAASPQHASLADRLSVERANAAEYLQRMPCRDFDCIYLDPMFPANRSGAKPAKEMQILQALTANLEIEPSFELALERAGKRVVVKRPLKAPRLTPAKPDLVKREKSIRFDVYLTA